MHISILSRGYLVLYLTYPTHVRQIPGPQQISSPCGEGQAASYRRQRDEQSFWDLLKPAIAWRVLLLALEPQSKKPRRGLSSVSRWEWLRGCPLNADHKLVVAGSSCATHQLVSWWGGKMLEALKVLSVSLQNGRRALWRVPAGLLADSLRAGFMSGRRCRMDLHTACRLSARKALSSNLKWILTHSYCKQLKFMTAGLNYQAWNNIRHNYFGQQWRKLHRWMRIQTYSLIHWECYPVWSWNSPGSSEYQLAGAEVSPLGILGDRTWGTVVGQWRHCSLIPTRFMGGYIPPTLFG